MVLGACEVESTRLVASCLQILDRLVPGLLCISHSIAASSLVIANVKESIGGFFGDDLLNLKVGQRRCSIDGVINHNSPTVPR
jgi:hypothetical protein